MSEHMSEQQLDTPGVLYIVSTPIGNLSDITYRAIEVLKTVDFIAAEDTRHSKRLLDAYGICTQMFSLHDHNERNKLEYVITLLQEGKNLALISDAGTPLVSDPGFNLVSSLRKKNLPVTCVPGACAAIAGLSISGLASDRFYFEGFLPAKTQARTKRLQELQHLDATLILYESPHRLLRLLEDVVTVYGSQRVVCLAREITKKFETVSLQAAGELLAYLRAHPQQLKGESVVLVDSERQASKSKVLEVSEDTQALLIDIAEHMPPKVAASIVSRYSQVPKKTLYELLLDEKK